MEKEDTEALLRDTELIPVFPPVEIATMLPVQVSATPTSDTNLTTTSEPSISET